MTEEAQVKDAQQQKANESDMAVVYQVEQERLLKSIRLLQGMVVILLVFVGALLFRLSQISHQVEAAVRSVDDIHLGINDAFKRGLPELEQAQELAKQLKADLAEGGSLSQRLEEASDRAIEKAKQELPKVVDAIIKQKIAEIERQVQKIKP
jgi:hypothetical protein